MKSRNLRLGSILALFGGTALLAPLLSKQLRFAGIALAIIFFMIAGTILGKANRLSQSLLPFLKKRIRVDVWGLPLPGSENGTFTLESVSALGAGLHLYLQPTSGGPGLHLKLAQPKSESLDANRFEIREVAYVQWVGKKIKRAGTAQSPAVVLIIQPDNPG